MEAKSKQYFFTTIETNSNLPPQFSEIANKSWILFGESNDYPDYLVELYNRSSTHNAIIKGKHKYICGQGWLFNDELPVSQQKLAQEFIDSCNNFGQPLYDVVSPAVLDWLIYGGLCFKAKHGILSKKPEHLYYKDYSRYRISKDEEGYFESKYWTHNYRGQKMSYGYKPLDIQYVSKFDYEGKGEGLIYYRDPRPQMLFYPLPEYIGCIQDVETEVSISEFHNNNVKSGFSAGFIIEFTNGIPEADEQAKIIREIKDKYTGAIASGELFVSFADSKERGVNVIPIRPNDLDKQFEVLRKDVNQSIITNHSITSPMLMAIKTEGQLGGNNEILTSAELFQNSYVDHKQKVIAGIINKFFKAKYGFDAGLYIQKMEPVKKQISEGAVISVMTQDEIREAAGLPPLTGAQKAELKKKNEPKKEMAFSASYDYDCIMLSVPAPKEVNILPKDLYLPEGEEDKYGLEKDPHVTIMYGLHSNDYDVQELKSVVKAIANPTIELNVTGISIFDNPKYDVVKFDVESPACRKLNSTIEKRFPFTTDHPDYTPHITIGYVKKGLGKKYATTFSKPIKIASNKFVLSFADGGKQAFYSSYDPIFDKLKACAMDLDGEILAERECRNEEDFSPDVEQHFQNRYLNFTTVYDLPYYQSVIYQFIASHIDGKYSIDSIAEKLSISAAIVLATLNELQRNNFLNFKFLRDGMIDFFKVNPVSNQAPPIEGVPSYKIETRWRYSGPNDDRVRPFCDHMLNGEGLSGKVWKREDIDKLSIQEGRNVWLMRGGWYTLPNGNKRPSCRHYWQQLVVRVKQ